jgi:hypothetical protein
VNVHNVSDIRHIEIEITIAELKKHKSLINYEILVEMIQTRSEILLFAIHKLINFIWNKEELSDQWNESIVALMYEKGDKTD